LADIGPCTVEELRARCAADPQTWLDELVIARRVMVVASWFAAAEDASRLRDALGWPIPQGLPIAFTDPVEKPLDDLVARYARTHGPFHLTEACARLEVSEERVRESLTRLEQEGRVVIGEFRPGGAEREWCDTGVLRVLRRRSLAALRHEIEPVDAAVFARFLPAWQGVSRGRRGLDALVEALEQLQGMAIPASVLERDVLPVRVDGYRPNMLDELCAAGELVWIGAGALGADDGRVRLFFRDRVRLLAPRPNVDEAPSDEIHDALRDRLLRAGASFWPDLVAASGNADEALVLAASWDLVWAGEVTNDTFGPLRSARRVTARKPTSRGRPQPGRLTRLGPPAGAGRWSLVVPLLEPEPSPTDAAHATALQLLDRNGIVTREAVRAEGIAGGFAGVYPVLKALEEAGRARRGWFVAGLGAAQFALPGAVDRLRAHRRIDDEDERGRVHVLAATDPAQPFGAALSWPEGPGRPARAAGAYVVLVDGACAAYVERGGKALLTFGDVEPEVWAGALVEAHKEGRLAKVAIERIDDEPARTSPYAETMRHAGFADGYKGLTLRD
jgi:ATP-dependent Lhr-like helicase